MTEGIDATTLRRLLQAVAATVEAQKDYLSQIDAAVGDGDHGVSMARGFRAAEEKLEALPETADAAQLLRTMGMAIMSAAGGATGPLFGTVFIKAGGAVAGRGELGPSDVASMLEAALAGVQQRGGARVGDRTMVDALQPAAERARAAADDGMDARGVLGEAVQGAAEGVEATKTMVARTGKSAYLGERALGHQDPGATSLCLVLRAMRDGLEQG